MSDSPLWFWLLLGPVVILAAALLNKLIAVRTDHSEVFLDGDLVLTSSRWYLIGNIVVAAGLGICVWRLFSPFDWIAAIVLVPVGLFFLVVGVVFTVSILRDKIVMTEDEILFDVLFNRRRLKLSEIVELRVEFVGNLVVKLTDGKISVIPAFVNGLHLIPKKLEYLRTIKGVCDLRSTSVRT